MPDTRPGEPASALRASDAALERLEPKLKIDKFALDDEIVEHAAFLNEIGKYHAEAVSYRDEAKNDVDGTKAKLDQELRMQAAADGTKVTESGIASQVTVHPEFQRALARLGAWSDRVNAWRVTWESCLARTDMLKTLGHLYSSGYWADQSIAGDRREARARQTAAIQADVQEQRRSKRLKLADTE